MRKISVFVFLCGLFSACDSSKGPSFNLATPSSIASIEVEPGQTRQTNQAEAEASPLGLSGGCGNPNDWEPDDAALQSCLDMGGSINLVPGNPGYIVNGLNGDVTKGLILSRSGTALRSSQPGISARITVGKDLFAFILQTSGSGVDNFVIDYITFDGKVDEMAAGGPYRRRRDDCGSVSAPGNVFFVGSGFKVQNSESVSAMCGTGMGLLGSNYYVVNNYVAFNGRDKNSGAPGIPWADGMTVLSCEGGYIARNVFVDNTDIDLVLGGGRGCVAELNTIGHYGKYAFSGLNIGNFNNGGNHAGSEYRGNKIYSEIPDRLGIGISVGSHMWDGSFQIHYAGRVVSNTVYGASINMYVDGVFGGEITGNNIYDPRGDDVVIGGCQGPLNYGIFPPHVQNTVLQDGWERFPGDKEACDGAGTAGLRFGREFK